ncbi:uncharacterized protein M6D78_011138 [Vipera latastei]
MPGPTEAASFLARALPFLWPLLSLSSWSGGCFSTRAAQCHLMPPPLSVTCARPENRVYQQQDHPFRVSCLWDRYVVLHYSKAPRRNPKEAGAESPVPPLCHWYRDAILVNKTTSWTGKLMLGPGLPQEGPHPPWASTQISVQCTSVSCLAPLCLYHNLSIEVVGQDIHLFLLQPHILPILERQPVRVGWCARLKSSAWRYHFKSHGGHPEDLLIPTNQHNETLLLSDYPSAELYRLCMSYYSYHVTVQYPLRGSYIASISYQPGPQSSLSLDFFVEPALLFVFRVTSQLRRESQGALSLSWNLQQLSPEIVAYQLLETQGYLEWSHSYDYNPFGLHSHFCTVPTLHQTKETVVASVYFRTIQRVAERVGGRLDFSNRTLIFRTSRRSSISVRLNPQENTISTYIFSRAQGLYYSTQKGNLTNGLAENASLCYVLYQQAGLSYLITVKFVQLRLFRFSLDIYLNRKEALFRSLGEKEVDIYVFNSTFPDSSLAYVVWFIPVQHPLLQCEWGFSLQVFDPTGRRLVKNDSFAYADQTPNAARFLPDSVFAFNPASYAGFVARVECIESAKIPIVFTARFNIYVLKVIEFQLACQQKACTIPKVRIHRAVNTKHILYYTQRREFTLAADMQVSCPGPKATKVSWNIYKVSDLSDTPDWSKPFNPPGIEGRNFITLKVPCSSLDTGLYLFNFSVQLISSTFPQKIERSDAVLVEVGSDRWGAVINGGHFRSVGFSDRWILKGSVLSNGEPVSMSQGLSYTWYCTKQETDYTSMTLSRDGKCYPDQIDLKWTTSSDSIQMVLPEILQANNTYHFLLVVQNGSRIAHAQQTIHVEARGALMLKIACIENCGTSVISTQRFSLSGKCGNCREIKSSYYWSLRSAQSNEVKLDWSSRTTTGRSSSYLHFKAFALVSIAEESYILSLKVTSKDGQSSICEYSFYVNAPPQIGKCVLNPRVGTAFLTKFIIQCNGFEDRNQPLAYKVIAASDQIKISSISSIQNNTLGIIIYAGHEAKMPWSFLPPGRPSQNSALTIYVQVSDALGASSQVALQATVLGPRLPKSNALHQQLHDLMNGSSAPMAKLLITKDYVNIGYIVYMVASALNHIKASPSNQVPKIDLRQRLLDITSRIPIDSIRKINQVILSISQATHEIAEVTKASQLLAVRKLKTVSEALRRHRDRGLGSKETEILSNGILTGLSNILGASLLNHRNPNMDAIKEVISVTEILADLILQGQVPGGHETKMAAQNWTIRLWKDKTWDVSETFSNRKQCRNCFYPKLKQGSHVELEEENVVSTVLYEFEHNPFPWLTFADNIGTMVTGFKMVGTDSKGDPTSITPDVFEMILTRKEKAIFDLTVGPDKKLPKTTGGFNLDIERNTSDIFIQLVPKMKITFQVLIYLGVNLSHPPLVLYNASHLSPPTVIQKDTSIAGCAIKVPYFLCLPKSLLWSPAYNRGTDTLKLSIVLQSHPFVRGETTTFVRVAVFAAGCLALEDVHDQWKEESCSLGPQTSWSKIHCVCKAKKHSPKSTRFSSRGASGPRIRFFAGKVLLFPNQVDMKMFLLQPTGKNPVPGLIVFAVFLIYIFLAVWVRRKDRIDIEEQIIDLPDNDPFHTRRYLVTIYTGSRPSAGTNADVFIDLIGQNGSSDVHLLKHPAFPDILQSSCIDTFMLTTEKDLGDLVSIHIWHNYCGFGPNWYLSRIQVLNIDTNKSWLFLCRRWLALGRNKYQIEWTFEVTDPQVPISRIDYLLIMFSYRLFHDHLWFSIFFRSLDCSWTRFQRLSCCLAILLTSLLINTIIFNTKKEEQVHLLEMQYLRSVTAGVLSALISVPVGWIAVSLFKYSTKGSSQGQGKESFACLPGSLPQAGTQISEVKSEQFSATDNNFSNNYATEKKATLGKTQKLQWRRCLSCSAWFFVFLIAGVASFFITFIGLSFDDKTSSEWLIAALISFCLHVSFFETLQVAISSSWNICLEKYCANIPWRSYRDTKYEPRMMEADEMMKLHDDLVHVRASNKYQPIKEEDVTALQKKQMVEPIVLHLYSAHSKLLRFPHRTINLFWNVSSANSQRKTYSLVDAHSRRFWSTTYNPYALRNNYSIAPSPPSFRNKVVAHFSLVLEEAASGNLSGALDFSGAILGLRIRNQPLAYLTLRDARKIKADTYLFTPRQGFSYLIQGSSNDFHIPSSIYYLFYQQHCLSYLITIEFVHWCCYRFSIHLYLNQKGVPLKSYSEKDVEIHIFNSGPSFVPSLVYVAWFIPLQNPLLQRKWTFNLQCLDVEKEDLLCNATYSYRDRVKNAARFISDLPLNPALYAGFIAQVNCRRIGQIHILLETIVSTYTSKALKTIVDCLPRLCFLKRVKIQESHDTNLVLNYSKNDPFILSADIEVNCSEPRQTHTAWRIYKVPDMKTGPDWSKPLNPSGIGKKDLSTLNIPAGSLDEGLYLFNLTITLITGDTLEKVEDSDSVFVKIRPNRLWAVIAGGDLQTVRFSDRWILDGSASSDPDAPQPFQGLTFTWYCSKQKADYISMTLSETGKCCPDQADLKWTASSEAVQTVLPRRLQGRATYYFLLVVHKGRRRAQVKQRVRVQPDAWPALNVTCIENCGRSVNPTERFCLFGKCLNCRRFNKPRSHWSLFSGNSSELQFDWASRTSTGRSNPYLCMKPLSLMHMAESSFRLVFKVSLEGYEPSLYVYSFVVNIPPALGKCSLNPPTGTAFLTKFSVHCSGFRDQHLPLTYKVKVALDAMQMPIRENSTLGTIVYFGDQSKSPPSFLPIGVSSKQYLLTLYVQIYDDLGAYSQITLPATVHSPLKAKKPEAALKELHSLTSGTSAPITSFLNSGNYFSAGYFVHMVASALNDLEVLPRLRSSKTKLREILLNHLAGIPTTNIMEANHMISSILQITQEIGEMNRKSQLLLVQKLKNVTDGLRKHNREKRGSKEIHDLGTAILAGLSKVLKASLTKDPQSHRLVAGETVSATEILADLLLQGKVPGEKETTIGADDWTITLRKEEKRDFSETFARRRDCRNNCFYPKMKQVEYDRLPDDAVISTVLYDFDKSPFFGLPSSDDISTRVGGFKMAGTKSNGEVIEIVPDVVEMILTRNEDTTAVFEMLVERSQNFPESSGGLSLEVPRNSKDILIQIVTKQKLTFQVLIYVGLKPSHPPIATFNVSHNKPVVSKTKNSTGHDCVFQRPYIFCLSQKLLKSVFQGSRAEKRNISIVFRSDHFLRGHNNSGRLGLALFTADCLYLDDVQTHWRQDTCHLGPQTTWQKLHCVCTGKRRTVRTVDPPTGRTSIGNTTFLAGKVTVYPDPAEMRKIQLAQIQKNPVTILTVVFIFLTYIMLAIWAMRKDMADVESKAHTIVLPDNDPFDKVCYLVTLYTGSRVGAGTTATVFIQLIGDQAVSDVHRLSHPEHVPFLRGSINTFLLTTKNDLGEIYCLQAWHDNAGSSPNWFLSRVKVENMYTKQSWMFICRKWFALDKDNGLIERVFVAVQPLAPLKKIDFFLISLAKDLADNHLWFSLFARVCTGSFNRLQRLSCCLATVFCILLINMMFFKADKDQQMHPGQLQYLRLLIIGVQSAFISVPLQMIITALFKYSQKEPPDRKTTGTQQKVCSNLTAGNLRNWKELLQKCYLLETASEFPGPGFTDSSFPSASNPQNLAEQKNIRWRQRTKIRYNCTIPEGDANIISTEEEEASQVGCTNISFNNNCAEKEADHQTRPPNTPSMLFFKRPQIISWWNRYASWMLVLVISAASSFSIILYGVSQDYETSLEWLAASAISLVVSMLFLQTLNVLFFSALKSLHPNSSESIPWSIKETFLEIKLNGPSMNADDMRELHYDLIRMRGTKQYQPLEEDEVTIFKKREKIRHQAFVFLKDVICHFVFLILILNIAYSMEITTSFYYNQDMNSKLSEGLFEVSKIKEIYLWLKQVFLRLIHNDLKPTFLPETWSKILGLPKMRQIRAKHTQKECFYPHSFVNKFVISKSHCLHKYGADEEDQRNYLGSWKNPVNKSAVNHFGNFTGFTYHTARDPWRYNSYGERNVYEAGGYAFHFYPEETLSESMKGLESLEEHNWLDENSWVLIVEMTTFNPDTDLFCSISVIFELSHLGPINTTLWIHSYKLPIFKQLEQREKFVFILVGYMLAFYIIDEFCVVEQQRLDYLKNVSNLINFGIKAVCCFFLLQLAFKFKLASSLIDLYLRQPNGFIPFHKVSLVDKTLRVTLGFLAFLIVLKTLRYSRFFYDVRLAQRSILAALPGICSMALVVAVYFFVYMAFGYLVFGQYEWNYNKMSHSAQTVFSYCVSAFKDTAFRSNRALGGLFLASFMMVMICVLINLFQAVIMSAYEDMKQPVYEEPSDEAEVVNFLFHKIRRIWAFITFRPVSTTDTELFNRVLFGLPERRNTHHLGLKARKINGRKMVYLVI